MMPPRSFKEVPDPGHRFATAAPGRVVLPGVFTKSGGLFALIVGLQFVLFVLVGCDSPPASDVAIQEISHTVPKDNLHPEMAAILADAAEEMTSAEQFFLTTTPPRSELIESLATLSDNAEPIEKCRLLLLLSIAEINRGNERSAIESLTTAEQLAIKPQNNIPLGQQLEILYRLGVYHMRLAETENCCLRNSPDSCIIPFQPAAIHTNRVGAEKAIGYFSEVLEKTNGRDERSKWLLNIAYMALGDYPDNVPKDYLIDFGFASNPDLFPRFRNIAAESGITSFNLAGSVVVDDFDNDGLNDILTSSWDPREPMRFYKNFGRSKFRHMSEESGLQSLLGGINMVQADFDNDGDLDVYVLRGGWLGSKGVFPNSLLENDGQGGFTDITFQAGLGEFHYPSHSAGWADYDNDGDLDLFVGNEGVYEKTSKDFYAQSPSPSQLFRNEGNGTFTDVAKEAGVENFRYAKGITWGDFNNDRYPDIYISNFGGPNRLYQNNQDGTFADVAEELKVDGPLMSFPVWFWDFNNDGYLDLYVPSYSLSYGNLAPVVRGFLDKFTPMESPKLFQGNSEGKFKDVSKEQGLSRVLMPMGCNFGDLDNDGFTDFYLGTGYPDYEALIPNVMFRNCGGKSFQDVTYQGGFGHLQKGHGIAFADLDSDGDQEVIAQMGGFYEGDRFRDAIFQNPGFGNHWLKVKLVGTESNRSGIGARIRVVVTENGNERSIYKHVNSGGSFGANPLSQSIGVGKASKIDRIEVYWPSTGVTQTFSLIPLDQTIQITEGQAEFEVLDVPRMAICLTVSP